jgi:hypothetical protein
MSTLRNICGGGVYHLAGTMCCSPYQNQIMGYGSPATHPRKLMTVTSAKKNGLYNCFLFMAANTPTRTTELSYSYCIQLLKFSASNMCTLFVNLSIYIKDSLVKENNFLWEITILLHALKHFKTKLMPFYLAVVT